MKHSQPTPRARDSGNDATKGLLIALVALGHCVPAQRAWPWLAAGGLYDFHVIGFLLLPFLRPAPACTARTLADRAVRYLVPFAVFAVLSCAVWHVTMHPQVSWSALPLALVRGDVVALGNGVGFTFLWFMPSLLSLSVLRSVLAAAPRVLRLALVAVLVAAHGLVAGMVFGLPLNPLPALFVLPLGWAVGALAARRQARWLWLALAVGCAAIAALGHHHINVAALLVPDWRSPQWLALHDVYAVAATLAAIHFGAALARLPGLVQIGRYSLVVYLSHQFVLKLAEVWSERQPWAGETAARVVVAAVAVPASLAFGWLLAQGLERPPLHRWVLPQTMAEWPLTARLVRASVPAAE